MPTIRATADEDSQSTEDHRQSVKRLSFYWITKVEGLAEEVSLFEIEKDEELRFYIKKFLKFDSSTPIPYKFDENLQPENENNKRMNTWKNGSGYIGKHLLDIRQLFPNHQDYAVLRMDQCPTWYKTDRETYMNKFNKMR